MSKGTAPKQLKSRKPHMAGLRFSTASLRELGMRVLANWGEDSVPRLAASFSFYAILSLAPLLVLAIAAAGLFFGEADVRRQLLTEVGKAVGKEGKELVDTLIGNTYKPGASTIATLLSLAVTFFSASNLFMQLNDTINSIWGIPTDEDVPFWKSMLLTRIFSFVAVLVFGIITLGWLALDFWLNWMEKETQRFMGWPVVSIIVSVIFLTLVFAITYKTIPKAHASWGDVWIGAIVAAILVAIAKYLLGLYFAYANVAGAFGPAGALVLILMWIYYTSQIYFFGAEVVYTYSHTFGSRSHMEDNKQPTYS
ncbi:MAG: YihY/virulence factor BrkB family protein [Fimbriimonas sp.]